MAFVILDRDGVINFDSDEYIKSPQEWLPIPGSLEAIAQLNRAGYQVLVATNQSGIARGFYDHATLEQIHAKFLQLLAEAGGKVTEIFFCPHHPRDECQCRKPQPGLLEQIQQKYAVDFTQTFFVGDSISDILVAQIVGCKPLLVMTGKGERTIKNFPEIAHVPRFADLAQAVDYICQDSA